MPNANLSLPRNTNNDNRIAQCRLKAGITQEKLAEMLGVTQTTVYRWESGDSFPRRSKLLALAKIFKCDPGQLI